MSRAIRHAPKLREGMHYIIHYGSKPVGHVTSLMRQGSTVCGLKWSRSPPWGSRSGDVGAGQHLCRNCDRMKDADTA